LPDTREVISLLAEEDIRLLIQIVQKDLKIQEKRRVLESAPERIKKIDRKLKTMEEELHEAEERNQKLVKERLHLEGQVELQNDKINQKKIELNNVKTNKEYRALEHEIEYLKKQVDKEEERIIAILDELEVVRKEVETVTARIDAEKETLLAEKKQLEDEMTKSRDQLTIIEDEKVRILPHISERVRSRYNRILEVKGDSGVANLLGDICQGCYSRVPPQKAHEIRKNNSIQTCEVCGRILVYYPLDDRKPII
jgi:predicted  nucleic acid-binding Zn-ribbon protein